MERFTRVLCLFAVGFALTLTPLGEKSAEQPASDGVTVSAVTDALFATQPLAAQNGNGNGGGGPGVTCGWCETTDEHCGTLCDETGCYPACAGAHRFPNGGDECGWTGNGNGNGGSSATGGLGDKECSRCGGTSHCHEAWWFGESCHLECGPGGGEEFAFIVEDLMEGVEKGDVRHIARVVGSLPWVTLEETQRTVRVAAPCSSDEGALVIVLTAGVWNAVSRSVSLAE